MSAWQITPVNGALIDTLVTDFDGNSAETTALPIDARFCLTFDYAAAAATQVRIWLAYSVGAADEDTVLIYDSANQTPVADMTQFLRGMQVDVPIDETLKIPMALFITKAATNANIRWQTVVRMGPGC